MSKTHVSELWALHTGLNKDGGLTQLIDLSMLACNSNMIEIERKYKLPTTNESINHELAMLFAKVGGFVVKKKLRVLKLTNFVGIDQYYIFEAPSGDEYHFRYRSGANRPPQLTVKYQLKHGSNLARGEINVKVDTATPDSVRAFMSVIAVMTCKKPITFANQQSGQIWIVCDPKTNQKVEIVVYRVRRITQTELHGAFAEIETLGVSDVGLATSIIDRYEAGLKLRNRRCPQSIAEMFRP